jgi:hypothetical protein
MPLFSFPVWHSDRSPIVGGHIEDVKQGTELVTSEPAVPDEHLLVVEGQGAEDGTSSTGSGSRRMVLPLESRVRRRVGGRGDGQGV